MAANIVQFAIGRTSGGNSVNTNADPKNTAASGRTYLVFINDTGTLTSIGDNKGNTYTPLGSGTSNGGGLLRAWICENAAGGSGHTWNAAFSGTSYPVLVALEISGGLTNPHDSGAYNQGGDDFSPYTITTSGANLAQADNLVVAVFEHAANNTNLASTDAPFSVVVQEMDTTQYWPLCVASANVNSTSPVTATFNHTNTGTQTGLLIVVIKSGSAAAPTITPDTQQSAPVGGTATFTPSYGESPTSYQWKKNGTDISGATSATYTTPTITSADNGAVFTVVATNGGGSTTSAGMTLYVEDIKTGYGQRLTGWAFRRHQKGITSTLLTRDAKDQAAGTGIWNDWYQLSDVPPVLNNVVAEQTQEQATNSTTITSGIVTAAQTQVQETSHGTFVNPGNLWTPNVLTQDRAWYISDNPDNTLVGGALDTLADRGNTALPAGPNQGVTTNRAALTDQLNGRPVWTVNPASGTLKGYLRSGSTNLARNVGGCSLFAVYRASGEGMVTLLDNSNGYYVRAGLHRGSVTNSLVLDGRRLDSDSHQYTEGTSAALADWSVTSGVISYADTSLRLYVDGTQIASSDTFQTAGLTSDTASQFLTIGHYTNLSNVVEMPMDGEIAELLVVRGAVTTVERQKIEGYLAWAWGLQSQLPVGHPYASAAPVLVETNNLQASQTQTQATNAATLTADNAVQSAHTDSAQTAAATLAASDALQAGQTATQASQTTHLTGGTLTAAQTQEQATTAATFASLPVVTAAQTGAAASQSATLTAANAATAAQGQTQATNAATLTASDLLVASQSAARDTLSASMGGSLVTAGQTSGAATNAATLLNNATVTAAQTASQATTAAPLGNTASVTSAQTGTAATNAAALLNKATATVAQSPAQATQTTAIGGGTTQAGQTAALDTTAATLTAGDALQASQTAQRDTSAATLLNAASVNASQTQGQDTLSATLVHADNVQLTADQHPEQAANAATMVASSSLVAAQTQDLSATATLVNGATVNAAQNQGASTDAITLAHADNVQLSAGQTEQPASQSVTFTATVQLIAAQTAGAATSAAALAASTSASATQTLPSPTQSALFASGAVLAASQQVVQEALDATIILGAAPSSLIASQLVEQAANAVTLAASAILTAQQSARAETTSAGLAASDHLTADQDQPQDETSATMARPGVDNLVVADQQVVQDTSAIAFAATPQLVANQLAASVVPSASLVALLSLVAEQIAEQARQSAVFGYPYLYEANGRTFLVAGHNRTYAGINPQNRTTPVAGQSRTIGIAPQSRTTPVNP